MPAAASKTKKTSIPPMPPLQPPIDSPLRRSSRITEMSSPDTSTNTVTSKTINQPTVAVASRPSANTSALKAVAECISNEVCRVTFTSSSTPVPFPTATVPHASTFETSNTTTPNEANTIPTTTFPIVALDNVFGLSPVAEETPNSADDVDVSTKKKKARSYVRKYDTDGSYFESLYYRELSENHPVRFKMKENPEVDGEHSVFKLTLDDFIVVPDTNNPSIQIIATINKIPPLSYRADQLRRMISRFGGGARTGTKPVLVEELLGIYVDAPSVVRVGKHMDKTGSQLHSQHNFPRLLNVMLCDLHYNEYLDHRKKADRQNLDTGKQKDQQFYWEKVLGRYQLEEPNREYDNCVSEHDVFLQMGINPALANRQIKDWKVLRDMYYDIKKQVHTALVNMQQSGTHESKFWNFCKGKINMLYMYEWTDIRTEVLGMVLASMPKGFGLKRENKGWKTNKSPSPAKKKLNPVEDAAIKEIKEIKEILSRKHAAWETYMEEKQKKRHKASKGSRLAAAQKSVIEATAQYTSNAASFLTFVKEHYPTYDGHRLLKCNDDLVLLELLDNDPDHDLFLHLAGIKQLRSMICHAKEKIKEYEKSGCAG
jgi:hypothetical protein